MTTNDFSNISKDFPHTILIVEDNRLNLEIILKVLSSLGYDCDTAENGQEALDACKSKNYSLIFMDIHMPLMNGIEATEAILNLNLNPVPKVVALTADVIDDNKSACLKAGMSDFIVKPIKRDDVATFIKKLS